MKKVLSFPKVACKLDFFFKVFIAALLILKYLLINCGLRSQNWRSNDLVYKHYCKLEEEVKSKELCFY